MKRLINWQFFLKFLFSVVIVFASGTLSAQIPTITLFTPTSGPIGTSLTINGTNFSTTAAENIVWFGAVQATVTAATATELTVTVPTGATYQPITVTVNGLTAYSSSPFIVTLPGLRFIDATAFTPKVDFTTGTDPQGVAFGDIDGDGKPDIVVTNLGSDFVSVYRNTSIVGSVTAGSFEAKVDFTIGGNSPFIALGDIDGDGRPDMVVACRTGNVVSVFRNTSTSGSITAASFESKVDFATGDGPDGVAIGDIDGDGKPDLAVTNYNSNTVSVFRNTGSPGSITAASFAPKEDLITGLQPYFAALGDLDSDGKPDLVVSNYNSQSISVYRNRSTSGSITSGSFDPRVDLITGSRPYGLAIGDIDGDNKPDISAVSTDNAVVSVFRNMSISGSITSNSFASKVDFATGMAPCIVVLSDINNDGKPDLIVENNGAGTVSILKNSCISGSLSAESFSARVDFAGGASYGMAVGDMDCDGKLDIVVTNTINKIVSVLHNEITERVPPVITSFTPTSGLVGTTVTITGTNFSTTLSDNIVWFGAVQATVTAALATQLTVTVPTGATYQMITVTVNGLTAYSSAPFNVTIAGTYTFDATSLVSKVDFSTGMNPYSVAIADIDGDGKPDLVVANTNTFSNNISVFRNISTTGTVSPGSFSSGVDFFTGSNPIDIAIGDIDGDGKPDLAVANLNDNTVSLFRNTSVPGEITSGSFAGKVDLFTGSSPHGVAIGDIDNDGKSELVVLNFYSSSVSVFRNNCTMGSITAGSFDAKVDFPSGNYPYDVAIGDIDGDGKPDLAVTNWGSNTVSLYRNMSTSGSITLSSLADKIDFTTGTNPCMIAIADIDGDGKHDLTVTNSGSDSFSIFRNISTSGSLTIGSLEPRADFLTGPAEGSRALAVGDVDGDGKPDLVIGNTIPGSKVIYIFINSCTSGSIGIGSFDSRIVFTSGTSPSSIAIGDVDGDGKSDLVVVNSDGNSLSVLRNRLSEPGPPTITSFTPTSGPVGASVTISGTNFNTTPANTIVWFGAVKATVSTASSTILTVTVPAGATYQPISVTDTTTGYSAYTAIPFNVTYTSSGLFDASTFAPKVDLVSGSTPEGVAVGDIDCDGKPDLVVANGTGDNVSVFRNISSSGSITSGSFEEKIDFITGPSPHGIALGDLDGDGKPDLVVANNSDSISVFRNTSTSGFIDAGTFSDRVDFVAGIGSNEVIIGDIDGDGKPDIIVSNWMSNNVYVFRNTSISGSITSGSFSDRVEILTGMNPVGLVLGDIDGDGKPDLTVANNGSSTISIFRNLSITGSFDGSSFAPIVDLEADGPRGVNIGDIDGDGKLDLVVANNMLNSIAVYRNNGISDAISTSSFSPRVTFTTLVNPDHIAIGDIDGDGRPDIAVTNFGSATVSLFKNTSTSGSITTGSLAGRVDLAVGTNSIGIVICDIDGDNKPDIIAANNTNNTISVFQNLIAETAPVPPVISSFTPTSGPIGTSLTINGTNFSTTAAENIVWFGAVQATVTAATAIELTVTVPAGATYQPITVTVNGLTAYSGKPFNVTFPSPLIIDASSFTPRVDINTEPATKATSTAIGDIDGDGKSDLVVANELSNSISVYRNISTSGSISTGSFAPGVNFMTGTNPHRIAIGDIDGDGKPDIAVTNEGSNSVSVFRNTSTSGSISTGSLAPEVDLTAGTNPFDVEIADIDGDGKPDLAVTNYAGSSISLFRNTSTTGSIAMSSFAEKVDITTGTYPYNIAVGDIDNDGKPDVVVTSFDNNLVSVLRNNCTPGSITLSSLEPRVDFPAGTGPGGAIIGDIDGDGKLDIVVNNRNSFDVSVYRNTSIAGQITLSSLAARVDFNTGTSPSDIALGDMDGDGKPDLAVTNFSNNTVSIFKNISTSGSITTSSFDAKDDFLTPSDPWGISIGDIDGDSKPDLIVAIWNSNTISILRNRIGEVVPQPPPVISSFSPSSGPIGTTVTLSGANFSIVPAENIVWFGAVMATVTAATAIELTVTVPAGATYQPITVTVNGLTAYSNIPFNVTFTGSGSLVIDATAFAPKVDFTAGTNPRGVAIADIDGDGKPDLVTTNANSNTVSVYRNISSSGSISSGSFDPKVDFLTGSIPNNLAIGDIDGDGKPDLAVSNSGSNSVSVFRNTSTPGSLTSGSFDSRIDFTTGVGPEGIVIGDIDGDGKPDLSVAIFHGTSVAVFRNTGITGTISASSFALAVDFFTGMGSNPYNVAIGDIDGDGKPDLAVTNGSGNYVSVFRNTSSPGSISTGSFDAQIDYITGNSPHGVAFADLDGDSKLDLAIANSNSNTISVLRNTSIPGSFTTGSFAAKVDYTNNESPMSTAIGDLDGDGKPDLVVSTAGFKVSVFRNTSTSGIIDAGSFAANADFASGMSPFGLGIGDIDGDGKPDLIAANYGSNTVSVLRNTISENVTMPPTIGSFTPTSGPVGTTVTITGSNFSTNGGDNIVRFGDMQADLSGATSTQLTVTVPNGATTNPISVTVNGLAAYSNNPFNVTSAEAPVIDSFTPTSGPVGTTVTITGSNFSTNSADNNVSFGGNQATVISSTTTQLIVTVTNLTGDHNIIVTVNGLTTYSNDPFNITSPGDNPSQDSFQFESSVLTLNGDGINEKLVIKNFEVYGKCSISVFNSRGVLIYSNKDYLNDWDMCINGRELNTGGYFYIAETESGVFRGSFSILRQF